jgi:hypothetical protein
MLDDETTDAINVLARSGFYDEDEIIEIVCESMFEPGEVNEAEVSEAVDAAFDALEEEQKSWPEVTDCDRLDEAFDAIDARGVIALQNAGYTQSDGFDDFQEALEEHPKPETVKGYCFYQGQDLERAVLGDGLYLAFGPVDSDKEAADGPAIGKIVREELERAGFKVEWDGTFAQRIFVPKIKWQRRLEEE